MRDAPMKDKGTATRSKLIHDPSSKCLEDLRGANFIGLLLPPTPPVGGNRLVVSEGGIFGGVVVGIRESWGRSVAVCGK